MSPDAARAAGLSSTVVFPVGQHRPRGIGGQGDRDRPVRRRTPRTSTAIADRRGCSCPSATRSPPSRGRGRTAGEVGRRRRADRRRAARHGDGGDLPAHLRAQVHPLGQDRARSSPTRASRASRPAPASATSDRRRWPAGRSASCVDGDLIEIVIDRERSTGTLDPRRGGRARPRRRRGGAAARGPPGPPRPRRPHAELPDDTRLWAALQQASGGTWGGCVYDVDRLIEMIQAGLAALDRR